MTFIKKTKKKLIQEKKNSYQLTPHIVKRLMVIKKEEIRNSFDHISTAIITIHKFTKEKKSRIFFT